MKTTTQRQATQHRTVVHLEVDTSPLHRLGRPRVVHGNHVVPASELTLEDLRLRPGKKEGNVSFVEFLRVLGSQAGECVWQHTLVGYQWKGLL